MPVKSNVEAVQKTLSSKEDFVQTLDFKAHKKSMDR